MSFNASLKLRKNQFVNGEVKKRCGSQPWSDNSKAPKRG